MMQEPAPQETRAFLEALIVGVPPESSILFYLWELHGLRTKSFPATEDGIGAAAKHCLQVGQDIYVGVSLSRHELPSNARVKAEAAAGIFGLWADVDVLDPAHKKANLPPDEDAATDLLLDLQKRPTVVLHSGHGLQVWWLFERAWIFTDDSDRDEAAARARGWQGLLTTKAASHGWGVDSVHDLARVLRVPGTINGKEPSDPRNVQLVLDDGPRYQPSDFEITPGQLPQRPPTRARTKGAPTQVTQSAPTRATQSALVLDEAAEPPAKWEVLQEREPRAAQSWDRARPELPDQSQSAYDLSLANFAAQDGWTDQEITDLLIAARRHNGEDLKLREDYYLATIGTARAETEAEAKRKEIGFRGLVPVLADEVEATEYLACDAGGALYRFVGGTYRSASDYVPQVTRFCLEKWEATKEWKRATPTDLIEYLRANAPLLWDQPPLDKLNVENGLIDLQTGQLQPHDPAFLWPTQLPITYDPSATCPRWDEFVAQVFPEDAHEVAYEILAFLMVPDVTIQKAVLLVGEGGNGKSVFLWAVQRFLGKDNCCSVPLQDIANNRFASSRLVGKLANIVADLPATDLADTSMFKAIVSGDTVRGERKYQDAFEFDPYCKQVFSANRPPQTRDDSSAFFDRWVVIHFDRVFRGQADEVSSRELHARLSDPVELSGVLNRALAVLPNIRAKGITEPVSLQMANEAFRATTDPISVWLQRATVADPSSFVTKAMLLEEYNASAGKEGRPLATGKRLGMAVRRLLPHVDARQRIVGGRRLDVWTGLRLRTTGGVVLGAGGAGDAGDFLNCSE